MSKQDRAMAHVPPPPLTRQMLAEELNDVLQAQVELAKQVQALAAGQMQVAALVARLANAAETQSRIMARMLGSE